jgi:hypothetical protein
MVEKKKDEPAIVKIWRMCVDYTNLNKACPKDPFSLPRIDQVIDSTAGCELLSFVPAGSNKNILYYPVRGLLLSHYAVWFKKCRCNLPKVYAEMFA